MISYKIVFRVLMGSYISIAIGLIFSQSMIWSVIFSLLSFMLFMGSLMLYSTKLNNDEYKVNKILKSNKKSKYEPVIEKLLDRFAAIKLNQYIRNKSKFK